MTAEARIMEYARENGYPVPAVESVSDDGTALIMERIDGPQWSPSWAIDRGRSISKATRWRSFTIDCTRSQDPSGLRKLPAEAAIV